MYMKVKKQKTRRSDVKIMTKEAVLLKHLRESRKLSIRNAARIIGISDSKLNHAENGRCDLNSCLILKIIDGYKYGYGDFVKMLDQNLGLPVNDYFDCVEILKRMDKQKLRTAKTILSSL